MRKNTRGKPRALWIAAALLLGTVAWSTLLAQAEGHSKTLILLAYQGEGAAQKTFDAFKASDPEDFQAVEASAIVIKHPDGTTTIVQNERKTPEAGDVIQSVLMAAKGPQGTMAGGATLTTPVPVPQPRAPQAALDQIKSELQPDSSVIVALVPQDQAKNVLDKLQQNASKNNEYQVPADGK